MPTVDQYRLAAEQFRGGAGTLDRVHGDVRRVDAARTARGGQLGALLDTVVADLAVLLRANSVALEVAAAECDQRAALAVAYESELAAWYEAMVEYDAAMADWERARAAWEAAGGMGPEPVHPPPPPERPADPSS